MVLPRNRADIDADGGAVRNGIYVETAGDRADVQRRPAEHIVARDIEVEILQGRYGAGGFVDRIDAFFRHRAVCGQPFCDRLEPQRAFVADQWPVPGWLRHDKRADVRQAFELLRKRRSAGAAGFLPRRDDQHHAGRARELVGQLQAGDDKGRDAAFHVRRAPAVEPSIDNCAGVRVDRPRLRAERNRIEMSGKPDRQLPWSAADASNDLRAAVAERDDVDRETSFFQQSSKRFSTGPLGTWRVDGIEANEVLRQLD